MTTTTAPSKIGPDMTPLDHESKHAKPKRQKRARKPGRRDRMPGVPKAKTVPIALRAIDDNLTITGGEAVAWFVLPKRHYSFVPDNRRSEMVEAITRRYADLVGHRIYLRSTLRPYPVWEWAQQLEANSPQRLPGWSSTHLLRTQQHLRNTTMSDKEVYLGVRLFGRTTTDRLSGMLHRTDAANRELSRLREKAAEIAEIVAYTGFDGRPATAREVEFLMHRSVALGLPAPVRPSGSESGRWETDDLAEFLDTVEYEHKAGAPTTLVRGTRNGQVVERHVAVLTFGRMDSVTVADAEHDPWMQATDRLPFPVEWMATIDLHPGPVVRSRINKSLLRIRDQQKDYLEHGLDVPVDLEIKAKRAQQIDLTLTEGHDVDQARAYGWFRLAVWGTDAKECLRRVTKVQERYRKMQVTVVHPHRLSDMACQYNLMREFIPGEPLSSSAYRREQPLRMLAAGLPTVSAKIGDGKGSYIADTAGSSRRAVMHDPHYATEQEETSGLVPLIGGLGSGKSALLALLCYEAAYRGIFTTVLDPSGPLAALAGMPEFAGHAATVNLLTAPPGTLNPYAVVPNPMKPDYVEPGRTSVENRDALDGAMVEARKTRQMLAREICEMLLPDEVLKMNKTRILLADAVRKNGDDATDSLTGVLRILSEMGEHGQMIGNYLGDFAEMPQARVFFGSGVGVHSVPAQDIRLLVLTMPGLDIPETGSDRAHWTITQQMSVPLLHLANYYVTRRVYGYGRNTRKVVGFDEVGQMGQWGSGQALFNRLGRDSRKWNVAVYPSSQDPLDILGLNVANWTSGAFVGRIEDEDIAAQALKSFLRIKPGIGYENTLANLSPYATGLDGSRRRAAREFLMRDVFGGVEKIRVGLEHNPALLDVIDNTATGVQDRR